MDKELAADGLLAAYRDMLRIRLFENEVRALFLAGAIKGTAHSYVGQEAVAVGVCAAIGSGDYIGSYHRGHGHCLAKGARMDLMMAELLGKRTGYCSGFGGSMHVADLSLGILGANGIVGASIPLCSGAALSAQFAKQGAVAVAFFGDGAINQGVFHETMNMAAVWKLPLIFVCENNRYALSTPHDRTTAGASLAARAQAYDVPGVTIDGNDVEAVHLAASRAVARARRGDGPALIEAQTYRWDQHSMRANIPEPRSPKEQEFWKARDPLAKAAAALREREACSDGTLEDIERAALEEVAAAVSFARRSDAPTMDDALAAVKAPPVTLDEPAQEPGDRKLSYVAAINEAIRQEMERDDSVICLGEDIGPAGGIFEATKGLHDRFGSERIRETPISEASFVGCGVGAALTGLRPIVEIQIFDFVAMTMDMIVNQAAKLRYMMGGKPTVPLVIRGPQGGGIRLAAQHSQSLEAWFAHVPGLTVVAPSNPYDAKGLLIAAIRDDNPVIFLEAKLLYSEPPAPVPSEAYAIPLGRGAIRRAGSDVTIVATMAMVPRALKAAERVARDGVSVEVIDPRTISPLDEDIILQSVRKTGRLIVAHEACMHFGFGGEVASVVMDKAFDWLDAPILRIGAPQIPMPYNEELERATIPSVRDLCNAIGQVMR